jgi:hypothetical protein
MNLLTYVLNFFLIFYANWIQQLVIFVSAKNYVIAVKKKIKSFFFNIKMSMNDEIEKGKKSLHKWKNVIWFIVIFLNAAWARYYRGCKIYNEYFCALFCLKDDWWLVIYTLLCLNREFRHFWKKKKITKHIGNDKREKIIWERHILSLSHFHSTQTGIFLSQIIHTWSNINCSHIESAILQQTNWN